MVLNCGKKVENSTKEKLLFQGIMINAVFQSKIQIFFPFFINNHLTLSFSIFELYHIDYQTFI